MGRANGEDRGRVARLSEKRRHSELSSCLRTIIHHPTSHRLDSGQTPAGLLQAALRNTQAGYFNSFYLHFPVHRPCFAISLPCVFENSMEDLRCELDVVDDPRALTDG